MRKVILCLATAAACLAVVPASAQVRFYGDDGDVGVRIGRGYDRDYDRGWDRDRWERRRAYRDDDCREITIRRRLPDGSVAVRRIERCD